ncbi:DUF6308 family protein [Mycolicibacterium peregrinum]|uniref:Uncharacterized protein n=1 Tax=Mycolicibacterium peregrinum TaxID=43304 RepID=A0A4Z0HUB3_MYCPR|nr:DUF6308 family protein [Mycolicibacterium peregrinum]TGB44648.1 hypothetical protein EJD94_09040 [Mycolicibacterium peregrinum]TGB46941.1 hypothetical protein EJD98_03460 [Mycolicibacterium peregrinum]
MSDVSEPTRVNFDHTNCYRDKLHDNSKPGRQWCREQGPASRSRRLYATGSTSTPSAFPAASPPDPAQRSVFDLAEWFSTNAEQVDRDLRRYFGGGRDSFTGRWFEEFAAIGDPNRFEASDVLAVEALSVAVPPESAARLIVTESERFNQRLRTIPREMDLWDADRNVVDEHSAAHTLHAELQTLPGIGWVVASKLLATKRPRLLPILDNEVRDFLRPPKGRFWLSLQAELSDPTRRFAIAAACKAAPPHVSLLRRIDVALWMAATQHSTTQPPV